MLGEHIYHHQSDLYCVWDYDLSEVLSKLSEQIKTMRENKYIENINIVETADSIWEGRIYYYEIEE